ncbi:hypothetical protein, partial [Zavarzinia sp.]|uniref:hypothetical protein n=1 Tax=Zavarzinia sp. TaxID=2027920 RepID=UPI003BB6D933
AGAGFGVSQLIASFAPGNKALSAGGGALAGAGIGFMLGGPIGAAVGGLAGLLGGLLNDKPSDKTGTGTVSDFTSTGSPQVGGLQGEKYSAENRAAATSSVDALRDAAQAAYGDYVDLSSISASISVGSRDGSRAFLRQDGQLVGEYRASSDEEGVKSIIAQSLAKIGSLYADKLPEEVRKALDTVDFSKDVDEALRLLDFAGSYRETVTALTEGIGLENEARKSARTAIEDQIDALGKFREDAETIGLTGADEAIRAFALTMVGLKDSAADVSETEAALAALDEQFKVLKERASELGLTSAEVAAGYKKSLEAIRDAFEADLDRAINSASGFGIYDQVQDLLDQQVERQKDAAALGLDSAKIARLSALEIAAATRKATDAQLAGIAEIVAASGSMAATIGLTMGRILSEIDSQIAAANQASTAARRSAEAWHAAAESVTEAIADLRGSSLSNLSPAQILAERRTALTETAAAAKAGDVDALAALPELAKSFLDQSRAYNGDAQVYGRDFDWVQRLLDQAGTSGDHLGDKADRQADLLDRQAELLQEMVDNLTAPEGPNAELLKRQQAELQRISGLLGVGNAGQEGGTASLSSLIAAVVGGNQTLAGLLSSFLQTTAEQQAALDAEAAAKAQAARVAAARAAYDAKVSAVGDTASNAAASVTARGTGLAKAVDDGSHLRAVSQTYDAGSDSLSAVVKDTAIGSETNVPRVEALAGILADLGRQVQDLVGGALPGFKLTMRSRGVASGDSYGIRLIMYKPGGGYTTKLIDDPNGLAAAQATYLSSLDETMGGLDAASLSALRKVDFSSPSAGMKALAEAIETARNPFVAPSQALEAGGMVGNGVWNKDSVLARYAGGGTIALAGGEWVTRASQVTPATRPLLEAINDNGLDGALRTLRVGA